MVDKVDADLLSHLEGAAAFVRDARAGGGQVLIHCKGGRSRSPTVLAAYLMAEHRLSLAQALQLIQQARPCAQPNPGFMSQLLEWQSQLAAQADDNGDDVPEIDCDIITIDDPKQA